jgi:hypothetical protein
MCRLRALEERGIIGDRIVTVCSSVTTTPGFTALTRTPSGARSSAAQRVIMSIAALLTQ